MQMFVNPQTRAFDKTALLNFLKTIDDDNIIESEGALEQHELFVKALLTSKR